MRIAPFGPVSVSMPPILMLVMPVFSRSLPGRRGRSALRNAHRLDGEARHELAGDVEQGRELTHHEIAVRNEVHGAKARRSLTESVERQDGTGEARQERPGVVAGGREAGLDGR